MSSQTFNTVWSWFVSNPAKSLLFDGFGPQVGPLVLTFQQPTCSQQQHGNHSEPHSYNQTNGIALLACFPLSPCQGFAVKPWSSSREQAHNKPPEPATLTRELWCKAVIAGEENCNTLYEASDGVYPRLTDQVPTLSLCLKGCEGNDCQTTPGRPIVCYLRSQRQRRTADFAFVSYLQHCPAAAVLLL
jgi:hypothetical protein